MYAIDLALMLKQYVLPIHGTRLNIMKFVLILDARKLSCLFRCCGDLF